MKKLIIIMFLFSLLAASCSMQEQRTIGKADKETIDCKELETVDLEKDGVSVAEYMDDAVQDIIYFDNSKLVYFVDEQYEDSDVATEKVYLYNKKTGKNECLLEVPDVHCSKADVCVLDKKVYYAFGHLTGELEYNSLMEVDLEDGTAQLIPIDNATVPFVDIAVTDENVFILKRNESGNRTDYILERMDGQEFTEIARTAYIEGSGEKDDEGEVILDIIGDGQYLYLYKEEALDKNNGFLCMTGDGKIREGYITDFREDMKLDMGYETEEEGDADSIWEIAKRGDYYIVQTLNNRNLIFDIKGNEVIKVNAPEQLGSKDLTYGSTLIEDFSQGRYLYFQELWENSNSIYVFDSQTGEFGHFEVEVDGEVKYMMKNDKNQFLFRVQRKNGTIDYIILAAETSDTWNGIK